MKKKMCSASPRGFDVPIITHIPVEKEAELNIRQAQDNAYLSLKEQKIIKKWNNLNSKTRKVGSYLQRNITNEISLQEMSDELDKFNEKKQFSIPIIKKVIADLNSWFGFGLRFKRIRGKPNYVKNVSLDIGDTEDYLRQKSRTIATMEKVYGNIDTDISPLRKKKRRRILAQETEIEDNSNENPSE